MCVSSLVRQQAHRLLGPAQADDGITALDTSDLSIGRINADRVPLAFLFISRGNMQRFRAALLQTVQDCRDTSVTAGLAGKNWLTVLKQEGIEVST
jgi:hypothetical protein